MPKLPDASDLSGVNIGAPRSLVNMPVPDIAGAANTIARGVADVGAGISVFADERRKKASAQERFDTKIGLLRAETAYADRVRDLDPLDPEYVEKKKAARREIFAPVLSNVKDPENRMQFDLETEADYVNLGIKADQEHRTARKQKQVLDLGAYTDTVRKRIKDKTYTGDAIADITQMVNDTELDEVTKQEILPELIKGVNSDQFDMDFEAFTKGGISVTPSVRAAVTKAVAGAGPDAPSYLENFLLRLAMVESRGGRAKVNPRNPEVGGSFQIHTNTAPELGLSNEDRFDDEKSAVATVKKTMADYRKLKARLGREPTPAELYLPWQQGSGGGPALLLAAPDTKAASLVGKKAVEQNLPDDMQHLADTITAKQFADHIMGTFNGTSGGGMIDADTTLEALRSTESYQRMGPDEQAAAEKGVITAIDKQNKEVEKSAKIDFQRAVVDTAVSSFEDRKEAEQYVKRTIPDPADREEALKMLTAQYNRDDEAEKVKYESTLTDITNAVTAAVAEGRIDDAKRVIPADGLKPKDREDLNKLLNGPPPEDDPKVYNGILALKLGTDQEKRYFANLDGKGLDLRVLHLQNALKPETIEKLAKEQEAFRKQFEPNTGKMPTYDTAGEMLNMRIRRYKVRTDANAPPADIAFAETMRAIMVKNTEAALARNGGRDLTPSQMEEVLDQTTMEFRGKKAGSQAGFWTNPETSLGMDYVIPRYAEEEEKLKMSGGALIKEAVDDLSANGFTITPQELDEWLKRKIDGAAD
jgi:hypothetical protein